MRPTHPLQALTATSPSITHPIPLRAHTHTHDLTSDTHTLSLAQHQDECTRVECLDFSEARLLANGATALAVVLPLMTCLRRCILRGNVIGGYGARAVVCGLVSCEVLQYIDMQRCAIGPLGARFVANRLLRDRYLTPHP